MSERPPHLVVLVPFDLFYGIETWGPDLLVSALAQNVPGATGEVLDLRRSDFMVEARKLFAERIEPNLKGLAGALRDATASPHERMSFPESAVECAAVLLGGDLVDMPRAIGLNIEVDESLRPRLSEFREIIRAGLTRQFARLSEEKHIVWGFSVFNCNFSCLAMTRTLKALFPDTRVLWGGSRMDDAVAKLLIERDEIDGWVMGPGEKPIVNIFRRLLRGEDIRTMQTERLFNSRGEPGENDPELQKKSHQGMPPRRAALDMEGEFKFEFDCVRFHPEEARINVLEDVRCRWSNCTFCREAEFFQRYSEDFYSPETEKLVAGFRRALREAAAADLKRTSDDGWRKVAGSLLVRVDSDDPSVETVAALAREVANTPEEVRSRLPTIEIRTYLRVRELSRESAQQALLFTRKVEGLRLVVQVPIETMNPRALQKMAKGSHVVQNFKALKYARDVGIANVGSYYFCHYPGEDRESVVKELEYLKRGWHLCPPSGWWHTLLWGSPGIPMAYQQDRYGVKVNDYSAHPLPSYLFGTNLPWNAYTTVDLRLAAEEGEHMYYEFMRTLFDATYRDSGPGAALRQARALAEIVRRLARLAVHQAREKDATYLTRVAAYIGMRASPFAKNAEEARWATFELSGNTLTKDYGRWWVPGGRESWSRVLREDELAVLRHLYHFRKRDEVSEHFAGALEKKRVEAILEEHIELGSIVAQGHLIVAAFNDPGYLDIYEKELEALSQKAPEKRHLKVA